MMGSLRETWLYSGFLFTKGDCNRPFDESHLAVTIGSHTNPVIDCWFSADSRRQSRIRSPSLVIERKEYGFGRERVRRNRGESRDPGEGRRFTDTRRERTE